MNVPDESQGNLLELKAQVSSLDTFRNKLALVKARYIGTFRQIDTYFDVPKGRLKLRETKGRRKVELIYYEREDIAEPKRSKVFIIELQRPEFFKTFLERVLKKRVVIGKKREIYRYKGTQIHLDTVKNLGTFIEFERKTEGSTEATSSDRKALEDLMETLGIRPSDLVKGSYSDIADPC